MAFSRVYLGKHFIADVLGGAVLGGLALVILGWWLRGAGAASRLPRSTRISHMPLAAVGLLAGFGFMTGAQAQQKDRDSLVRKDRSVMEDSTMWIYNDVEKGFRISQKNGKPLLIVFR